MKNKVYTILLALSILTGCHQRELTDFSGVSSNPLQLQVSTKPVKDSRGLVTSTYFPSGSRIGLSITDGQDTPYMGTAYDNVMATAVGSNASQKYVLDTQVVLGGESATIHAYYPWTDNADITAVPVTAGETDYMFAERVTGINASNPQANLVMQHALAAVRVNITRGSFAGSGAVSWLSVSADNIAISGTLDATIGTLSSISGTGEPVVRELSYTLDDNIQTDFIVVPTTAAAELQVTVNIDGKDYTVSTGEITLQQGNIHTLDLVINSDGVEWTGITVDEWGYDAIGNPVIPVGDHSVTIGGNYEGIAFHNTVNDDGTVTIMAVPVETGKVVDEVDVVGETTFSQTVDENTGIRTIILSNISTNENVVFNGCYYPVLLAGDLSGMTFTKSRSADGTTTVVATPDDAADTVNEATGDGYGTLSQSIDDWTGVRTFRISGQTSPYTLYLNGVDNIWLTATYDYTSTSTSWLLSSSSTFSLSSIERMLVDGIEINPVKFYQFSGYGQHKVKYKLVGNAIPERMFYGVSSLMGVNIPLSIYTIEEEAFAGCTGLSNKLSLPESVTSIGVSAFSNCVALTEVDLGTGVQTIGNEAFHECINITGTITIPDACVSIGNYAFGKPIQSQGQVISCININKIEFGNHNNLVIGDYAFYGCTGLTELDLGRGIKTIGNSAFTNCTSLTSYTGIPESVTSIGECAFEGCSELTGTLTIPPFCTSVGSCAFRYCSKLTGNLNFPVSCTDIGSSAFWGCSGLTGVLNIPNGCTIIDAYTFYGCIGLTGTVKIPDTCAEIGSMAFSGCENIAAIDLGTGLKTISNYVFDDCSKLTNIISRATTAPTVSSNTFYGTNYSGTLTVPKGATGYDVWLNSGLKWTMTESDGL